MRHIQNARYLTEDTTLEASGLNKARENNVQFLQGTLPSLRKHFSSFRNVNVQALRISRLGKTLLVY